MSMVRSNEEGTVRLSLFFLPVRLQIASEDR
jgi:hypothetical protein